MKALFGKHGEKILMAVLLVLSAANIIYYCHTTFGNKEAEPATGIGREVVVPDAPSEPEETPEPSTALVSLGSFKLTAYCPCPSCCGVWAHNRPTDAHGNEIVYTASGEIAKEGKTIAVDPDVIAYGTEVIINGRTYIAEDCGSAIKENRIDVYLADHSDALEFGVQYATVYVKENRNVQN